jgi:hypothetical protein
MSRYKWVYHGDETLRDVGILADGTLHNPNGYPDDWVRAAVTAADARRHERRSRCAKKAAQTRRLRQQHRVAEIAARILARQGIPPGKNCAICGRFLDDPASINRGIGSECWQGVLAQITALKARRAGVVTTNIHATQGTGVLDGERKGD